MFSAGFDYWPLDYGFFRAAQLLWPFQRQKRVRWFLDQYTEITEKRSGSLSVIAHSFGTYIVAGALEKYSEIRLQDVILCGSIVRRNYPWTERLKTGQVVRVLNDYGRRDLWVRLAEWVIADAGPSGARGFTDLGNGKVSQLFRPWFSHSDYFYEVNYRNTWVPFLKGEDYSKGSASPARHRNWKFQLVRAAAAVAVVGLIVWIFLTRLR